jgi:hypothetical protein
MTPIRAERARIPRRSGGSFLRRKYGKVALGERCRAGRDLAGIGKFDAEGQSVTPDQAAAPMRCAVGRQEQKNRSGNSTSSLRLSRAPLSEISEIAQAKAGESLSFWIFAV